MQLRLVRLLLLSLPVSLPLVTQAFFQEQRVVSRTNLRLPHSLSMSSSNDGSPRPPFTSSTLSRRDVVKSTAAGSFLAAALASGAPPALAADIAKQMQALEREFKDSVNSSGAPEKHIPKVSIGTVPGNPELSMVEVVVPHVMDAEKPHFIQAIWLKEEKSGDVAVAKVLPATEPSPPSLKCGVPKGATLTPYLYCNLHGLWRGESFIA